MRRGWKHKPAPYREKETRKINNEIWFLKEKNEKKNRK